MLCQEVRDRLPLFLDDELDPEASLDISRHLDACPECAAAHARLKSLSGSLQRELEYHRAPDLLRARIQRDARKAFGGASLPFAARAWRWVGAAAAVVAVAGGSWWLGALGNGAADFAVNEAVSAHVRSMLANHLTDVASTDQHTVKPWFNGKLDFGAPVADFAAQGYPLIGGRLDYLQGHTVAALVYQHRKHVINVFVWPAGEARDAVAPAITQRGFHVVRATHAGMSYWLVSDLNAQELTELARLFTSA